MFRNIGKKMKRLAKVLCFIGITLSCLATLILWISVIINPLLVTFIPDEFYIAINNVVLIRLIVGVVGFFVALIIAGIGALLSWITCFPLYGFGELVDKQVGLAEKVDAIEKKLDACEKKEEAPAPEADAE